MSVLIEWGDGLDGYQGRLLRSVGYRSLCPDIPGCCALPPVWIDDLLVDVRTQLSMALFQAVEEADEPMVIRLLRDADLDINFVEVLFTS